MLKSGMGNKSSSALVDEATSVADSEGVDAASAGDLGKLQKLIQKVEGNLIRRIATLEGSLSKISSLEDDMVDVKLGLAKALRDPDPKLTHEDVDNWNKNVKKTKELEDLLNQLLKDFTDLNGAKIKTDILQIFKVQ